MEDSRIISNEILNYKTQISNFKNELDNREKLIQKLMELILFLLAFPEML